MSESIVPESIRPLERSWRRPYDARPQDRAVVRGCGRFEIMVAPAPISRGFTGCGSEFEINRNGHQASRSMGCRWFETEANARKYANGELKRLCGGSERELWGEPWLWYRG